MFIAAIRSKNRNHSWIDRFSNVELLRNRLLPGGMRGNDLKELFVFDARMDFVIFHNRFWRERRERQR